MTRAPLPDMPAPLVPAEVDLRGLDYMPFFGHHLLGSEFHARCSDAEWRAGVTLWWASWNQVPAASLPDDDVALCRLADLGRDVKEWKKLRENALHGYVRCSDGRLYHRFLADQALIAWEKRVKEREKKKRWREGRNGPGDRDRVGDGTVPETGTRPGQGRGQNGQPPGDGTADGTGRDVTGRDGTGRDLTGRQATPTPQHPAPGKPDAPNPADRAERLEGKSTAVWQAFATGYRQRYGIDPVRNAKVNGQLVAVVDRLGAEEAPQVAAFYVGHNRRIYVEAKHSADLLLRDCEGLRTEWATGRHVTSTQALQADRTQTNANAFAPLLEEARARKAVNEA